MKSIGLSDEVYFKLLETKHKYEKQRREVLSYDKIIQILIGDRNEREGKNKDNKTRDDN